MESVCDFVRDNSRYLAAGVAMLGTVVLYRRYRRKPRVCGVDYPKDKVILHVFPRTKTIPNMGHFVMKLETYLRINKIPFQIDFNYKGAPKGKTPWIEYNGMTMGDSQLIIHYFNEKFNINMNQHLSSQERAIAWAIQKWLEEYTYWLNVHTRWVIFLDDMLADFFTGINTLARTIIKWTRMGRMKKVTYTVGVGRHTDQEVHDLMMYDLRQFAAILGDKQYIMGDKISEVDCAAFGVLSQVRWCTPDKCPGHRLLTGGELKNVMDYLDRIKNTYWRDWEDLLAEVKTS